MGFEPTDNGFAIRPLGPLGYAAVDGSLAANPGDPTSLVCIAGGLGLGNKPEPGLLSQVPASYADNRDSLE